MIHLKIGQNWSNKVSRAQATIQPDGSRRIFDHFPKGAVNSMRRRIVSIIAPPPPRISNSIVPRTLSQQQTSFPDVDDIICIILLDFFSNSDYSFIDLKSAIAFRLISKKIAEAIDRRLEEIYPNYSRIIQMGADVFNLLKTQVNSSVIVIAGFSSYKINLPRLQIKDLNNKNGTLTLLTGSGSRNYAVLKKRFDDAFQNNELVLSCLFRNLKSVYEENSGLIYFVLACLFFFCLSYHQLHMKAMIGMAPEYKIINNTNYLVRHQLFSCDELRSFNTTETTLWGLGVQTLINFCAQQESLCHPFSLNENFFHGNPTLIRECRIDGGQNFYFLLMVISTAFLCLKALTTLGRLIAIIHLDGDLYRTMIMNWLKKPSSEKLPLIWSEKTARNINNFFNPSLSTAVTVLDESPAQNTWRVSHPPM